MKPHSERARVMTQKFVALIRKEEETDYWVDIPDLPGCASCGVTEEKAKVNFHEALALHLEAMKEEGLAMPVPRSREDVLAAEEEDEYVSDYIVEF